MQATSCPVYGKCYSWFMQGVHGHIVNSVRPDLGISIEMTHASLIILDVWYLREIDPIMVNSIVDIGFFISVKVRKW